MKAFLIDRYGKQPGRLGEAPAPEVGSRDVLIEVHASSVNVLDSKISTGEFKLIPALLVSADSGQRPGGCRGDGRL